MSNSCVCCSHVVSGRAWVFTQVHFHVIRIPWYITQFVNFDAKMLPYLGNVLPESNPALEFYNYLVHCDMLWGVVEFRVSLIQGVRLGLQCEWALRLPTTSADVENRAANTVQRKCVGPNTEPCGTPCLIIVELKRVLWFVLLFIRTLWCLSSMYDWKRSLSLPIIPCFSIFDINMSWPTQSNAFVRSQKIPSAICLLIKAF